MIEIRQTERFEAWFARLADRQARSRILTRIDRLALGNPGDVKPVGEGVSEMREHFGPGWRMYYVQRGSVLIVMLGGGDKITQSRDIAAAKRLAATLEE